MPVSPQTPSIPPYQEGWELLVGPLAGKAVLCLDDGGPAITALAQRCARVCVVSPRARPMPAEWAHVEWIEPFALNDLARREGGNFDGLVVSDLAGKALTRYPGGLNALLAQARPLLREGAFVLVGTPNRWGLNRERISQGFRGDHAWSWRALSKQLRRLGSQAVAIHPVLTNDKSHLVEVIAPSGYHTTKNMGLARENIKQWLWGPRTARWFAPGLIAVGWMGPSRGSVIDDVAAALPGMASGVPRWTQYLVLASGKVIATFTDPTGRSSPRVVVVTRDGLAIGRRAREAETLRHLAATLPAPLPSLLPRVIDRFSTDGNECFVLQHIPGVTADAVVPGLERVTAASLDFLLSLHRATATRRVMDEGDWDRVIKPLFDSAVERNNPVATELRQLQASMREHVVGQVWTAVCSHGDFKIENVMYDPASFKLTGVIDWEHALLDGLPYIDLAYLLNYNRMLRGQWWLPAAHAMLTGELSAEERALEARYWEACKLPERQVAVMRALVIVHHIGVRWHGNWAAQVKDELSALIRAGINLLEHTPLPPSPTADMPPPVRDAWADRHLA